jgi:hypothetical protein
MSAFKGDPENAVGILADTLFRASGMESCLRSHRVGRKIFLRRPNVRMADMFRMTAWERPVGIAHSLILWASHLTDLPRVDVARSSRFLC